MTSRGPVVSALVLAASTLALVVGTGPAAYAEEDVECSEATADRTDTIFTSQESRPLAEMEVQRAHERLSAQGRLAGQGVVVAVIDSGVGALRTEIPVVESVNIPNNQPPEYYHGTAVAGLIAGQPRSDGQAVGIAPGASILDIQVYDDPAAEAGSDLANITVDNVVRGLDEVINRLPTMNIKVVNISLNVPDSRVVKKRINRLWNAGVVVVAPTGNRPDVGEPGDLPEALQEHHSGEDAAHDVHPADYANVLAVNASMTGMDPSTDPFAFVLENSETQVAAPTAGAVSYGVLGGTCLLNEPATSWAAAEVSGVLALLQSVYDESPARAVSRLLHTADGRTDIPNTLVGAGEVQAYQALTRPLEMDEEGTVLGSSIRDEPQRVSAPKPVPDVLSSTRRNAVWWGLLGGGTLLLALVLRPVLARRRSR